MNEIQVPMRDTGDCGGEPSRAPDGAVPQPRGRSAAGRKADPGDAAQGLCPNLADLHHMHYRSLFRLAALLTGDPRTAEAVVADSFAALQHPRTPMRACGGLPRLHRLVVAGSRRAARQRRLAGEGPRGQSRCPGSPQEAPRFETDAVVLALRALPAGQREAIVLTLYLNLTDEQAAAAMRVSRPALRRYLAAARTALRAALGIDPTHAG